MSLWLNKISSMPINEGSSQIFSKCTSSPFANKLHTIPWYQAPDHQYLNHKTCANIEKLNLDFLRLFLIGLAVLKHCIRSQLNWLQVIFLKKIGIKIWFSQSFYFNRFWNVFWVENSKSSGHEIKLSILAVENNLSRMKKVTTNTIILYMLEVIFFFSLDKQTPSSMIMNGQWQS